MCAWVEEEWAMVGVGTRMYTEVGDRVCFRGGRKIGVELEGEEGGEGEGEGEGEGGGEGGGEVGAGAGEGSSQNIQKKNEIGEGEEEEEEVKILPENPSIISVLRGRYTCVYMKVDIKEGMMFHSLVNFFFFISFHFSPIFFLFSFFFFLFSFFFFSFFLFFYFFYFSIFLITIFSGKYHSVIRTSPFLSFLYRVGILNRCIRVTGKSFFLPSPLPPPLFSPPPPPPSLFSLPPPLLQEPEKFLSQEEKKKFLTNFKFIYLLIGWVVG